MMTLRMPHKQAADIAAITTAGTAVAFKDHAKGMALFMLHYLPEIAAGLSAIWMLMRIGEKLYSWYKRWRSK